MKRTMRAAAAAIISAGFIFVTAQPSSAAYADPYTGSDPQSSGCATTGWTVKSWPLTNSYGQRLATVELRYSNSCKTNWIRVTQNASGMPGTVNKTITRPRYNLPEGGSLPYYTQTESDPTNYQVSHGMQVYAPGAVCVIVKADIRNSSGGVVGSLNDQWVC